MVRYSKDYGDVFDNVFTWGVGKALEYIFHLSEGTIYRPASRSAINRDFKYLSNDQLNNRQISSTLSRLKKQKYIESAENSIVITNKGKIKLIEKVVEKTVRDNKYRFISFDIPERLRRNRDRFRAAIKRMGFRQVQLSLWVTDKNVGDLVEIAANEYGIKKYVAYIISEKTDIDSFIKTLLKKK